MSSANARHIDKLNCGLILLSAAITYLIPFELLILSYAILGPAHYLTQIAWMHQKNYFLPKKYQPLVLATITCLMIYVFQEHVVTLLCILLLLALIWTMPNNKYLLIIFLLFPLFVYLCHHIGNLYNFVYFLLPTVIHVYIFTLSFMVLAYLKSGEKWSGLSCILLMLAPVFFLIAPSDGVAHIQNSYFATGDTFFEPAREALRNMFKIDFSHAQAIVMFFSFAYTYHYLNWFSKVGVIGWNSVPFKLKLLIYIAYLFIFICYVYDFKLGFTVALSLSMIHVILEFPLNMRTFQGIGHQLKIRFSSATESKM